MFSSSFAKLVAEVEADPRKLSLGLRKGADDVRSFTRTVQAEMKKLPVLNVVAPAHFNRLLKETKGDLEAATAAATRFNERVNQLQQSMVRVRAESARLADTRMATSILAADPFQGGSRPGSVGRSQSAGFGQGINIGNMSRAMGVTSTLANPATAQGIGRTQGAMLSFLFTIGNLGEQLASADTKWQKLDRTIGTALQTIANVAVFFGPKGYIVAGLATLGNFMSAFWTQRKEEVERAAKSMRESIDRMVDTGDIGAQMQRIQGLEMGRRSAGTSANAPNAFVGGIADIEAQIRSQEVKLREATLRANIFQVRAIQRSLVDLRAQLAPLAAERARLTAAVLNPVQAKEIRGLSAINVTAAAPRTSAEQVQDLQQQASGLVGLYKAMSDAQRGAPDVALKLLNVYDRLNVALAGMSDKSDQAVAVRTLTTELEKNPVIQLLRTLGGPGQKVPAVGVTPSTQMAKPDIQIPAIERLPVTLGQHIKVALQPLVDVVRQMGSYLISAGLGMLSQYGGAGGQAIASVAGGALQGLAMTGGNPLGGVVGGIVGAVDALFSMGRASKEAARAFQNFLMVQTDFINQQHLMLGDITQSQYDAIQVKRQFADQMAGIQARLNKIHGMPDVIEQGYASEEADLKKRLAELTDLERRRLDELEKGAKRFGSTLSESLTNAPQIWKVNLARWQAAFEDVHATADQSRRLQHLNRRRRNQQADAPSFSGSSSGGGIVVQGDLNIETRATNGRQLWRDFEAAADQESFRTTGRSGSWRRGMM